MCPSEIHLETISYETLILTRRIIELLTTVQTKMWPHLWPSIFG